MTNLTRFTFGMCINNLKLYCDNFKMSDDAFEAWYQKLSDFTDLQLKIATNKLCSAGDKRVTFQLLYTEAKHAPRTERLHPIVLPDQVQASAWPSPEKTKMQAHFMGQLQELLKIKNKAERDDFAEVLKNAWLTEFRKLPNYVPVEEVKDMIEAKDVKALTELGLINPLWKEDQKPVKLFGEMPDGTYQEPRRERTSFDGVDMSKF